MSHRERTPTTRRKCSKLEHGAWLPELCVKAERKRKMTGRSEIGQLRAQIHRLNHRLNETGADPTNADRALWGALAVAHFASVSGRAEDVHADPETVLSDLLADLMHWCNQQSNSEPQEAIRFDSALERRGIITMMSSATNWNRTAALRGSSGRLARPLTFLALEFTIILRPHPGFRERSQP